MIQQTPAGWHPDPQNPSQLRWWDGYRWSQHTHPVGIPTAPPAAMPAGPVLRNPHAPLFRFTSHISGKNPIVEIYEDRIEWERVGGVSGGKAAAAVMTMGMSLAVTGIRNNRDSRTQMIPMRSVTSVSTRRDGALYTIVQVMVPGDTIEFRTSHAEASRAKSVITQLMLR